MLVVIGDLLWHVPNHLTVSGCDATALLCPSGVGRVGAVMKKQQEKKEGYKGACWLGRKVKSPSCIMQWMKWCMTGSA
jgi:hypothetical protein